MTSLVIKILNKAIKHSLNINKPWFNVLFNIYYSNIQKKLLKWIIDQLVEITNYEIIREILSTFIFHHRNNCHRNCIEMELNKTPPHWKKPEDVMRLQKLRLKKRALQFRFTDQENNNKNVNDSNDKPTKTSIATKSKKNPFKCIESDSHNSKKSKFNDLDDTTSDGTLFRLFNFSQSHENNHSDSPNISFSNAFAALNSPNAKEKKDNNKQEDMFVDWTMRVKVRLMSLQPFPWNQKLKTCEEASGITGFVRCIDTDTDTENGKINLDTSPNARFHQCCLVWQHPSIPWIDLYPRLGKKSSNSNLTVLPVKEFMYKSWIESFRSLFQLVRAKQCPYFYVITNTFICLFRAAGINGYSEINVAVTPTSRGFRQLLKEEDIEFSMPLKKSNEKNKSPVTNDSSDTGYESLDLIEDFNEIKDDLDNEEEPVKWLQDMGVEEAEIKKLNATEFEVTVEREKVIDNLPESLIFVEGVEAQAFFNFLINCKSMIPSSGTLAGVPPTLLSPVAFTGASLTPLKVKESIIRMNDNNYYSMEVTGPVLPHIVHNLCDLMKNANLDKFSLTFANIESSKSFTSMTTYHTDSLSSKPSPVKTPRTPTIFGEQNLSDCGLKPKILARFCKNEVLQFDSIKFADSQYTCS